MLIPLCLAGCSGPAPPAAAVAVAAAVAPGATERLWQDASIFTLVGALIAHARQRVYVEMYELGRSDIVGALGRDVFGGVDVRVITDPTVDASRGSLDALLRSGVAARFYPVDDAAHQIDHVKLLVADSEAVIGGMNWGAHSDRNHDYVLETREPVEVARAVRIFGQDWALAAGQPQPEAPDTLSRVAQTSPGAEIRHMLRRLLEAARLRVWAEVYTLTDPDVLLALAIAHRRGADVKVLLDPSQPYNRHSFEVLSAAGVPVRWYPVPRGTLLHAKIGLFDGELMLGSANWTYSGLDVNHELDVETEDPQAAAAYGSRFQLDWARSRGG
ncbi:MAG TPA: phospholipase D-like domain-containing protein [Candidatus Dormibacteraeota bacterium]|nr:phospholipase D-like domain-containing protein [Candidatus Dormibacteraeota bacterium]